MNIRKKISFIFNKPQNIFVTFLRLLDVRCTSGYSNQFYNDHPDKYNFYGLSRMLSAYNVENVGIRVKEKKQSLDALDVPFIAHVGSEFVVVNKKNEETVSYLWHDKQISVTPDKFLDIWSGATLVADVNDNSKEPNYDINRRYELFVFFERAVIIVTLLISLFYFLYANTRAWNLLLSVNLVGVVVSGLLLLKQLKVQGKYIDNICSLLLPHSDCNSMLEGKASKLFNLISWSEIGFGYFLSNIFILLFACDLIPVIYMLNIMTLPFTLWSIGYQKFVAKQWCVLCLAVQFILWTIFLLNMLNGFFYQIDNLFEIFFVCLLYVSFILGTNMFIRFLSGLIKNKNVAYELKSLKFNENVFVSLLKKEVHYNLNEKTSKIWFGEEEAENSITVITNPHCNPCARMHEKIISVLKKKTYRIQYVFTSFSEELDESCLFLIASYQNYPLNEFTEILSKWFEYGKLDRHAFYKKYPIDIATDATLCEYRNHKDIVKNLNVLSTPTILFNGYKLPESYKLEDLEYFSKIRF